MKRFFILAFLLFITASAYASENYDIVAVYEKVELKDGTKVCDNFGNMEEVCNICPGEIGHRQIRSRTDQNRIQFLPNLWNFFVY